MTALPMLEAPVRRPLAVDRSELDLPAGFVRREFAAMGTSVAILLPEREAAAIADAILLVERWEATFSRFRPESELSRVNARAGRRVAVTELFLDVVEAALAAARAYLGSASELLNEGCLGHLPEIVDGDAPHTQRGCDAQAWGATEALRVWCWLGDGARLP